MVVLNSRNESEDITNIVGHVCKILDKKDLFVANHLVGVDRRLQDLIKISEGHSINDVLLLGIWGIGGLGKTTLAKAFYNQIGQNFESRSFLSNIREVWGQENGPVNLQQQLLSDICKTTTMDIHSIDSGRNKLKKVLGQKRVLVVLDDVSTYKQVTDLFGNSECFGLGSRIIITTRDMYLLRSCNANHLYQIKSMDESESIVLFSWHAFKRPSPKEGYIDLSRKIVAYSSGLPLALEILGSTLFDRDEKVWESVLDRLERIPRYEIHDMLKISYEGLDEMEKSIFLDISCFFIGMDRSGITKILDGSGLFPGLRISVLVERSLVTVDEKNKLGMHDLLREMVRDMIRIQNGYDELNWSKKQKRYDVFLSFRGDTRAAFTAHLYSSLTDAGIRVFKDDTDLPRGNDISPELLLGIEICTISIIIFSKDYAGSRWCLNELSKSMELRRSQSHGIFPVFYGVDPSEVRNQTSSFGDAFLDLIKRSSPTEDQVLKWRMNLREAASIAGMVVLNSRNESEDIKNIVRHVCKILDKTDLFVADHPVGMDRHLQDLIKISEGHSVDEVLLLGIWGMRGMGKTTLAKAFYNKIGQKFESRSFLLNIREVWDQDSGPVNLQQQLLSDICKITMMSTHSIDSGKNILKEVLCHKRVLVVLDDVNEPEQLNALFGSREWFGPGSRIIITTTNKHLLNLIQVNQVYPIRKLDESESIELFSWHAFKQPSPKEEFIDLSRDIVAYSGSLPLALEILGSYLFSREEKEWISALDKLKRIPNNDIQKKLKVSFDDLDDILKEIFLDISCFFIGKDRSDITNIMDGSELFADIGISVLVERSLVTVDDMNKLGMHDLVRDMGREIIRQKEPKQLGKRSRLWSHKEVHDVLSKLSGTEHVDG